MKQLTIRGFDEQLERCLRELARERQISLNRAALELMRRGAGQSKRRPAGERIGASLDTFVGVWSDEDEAELHKALEPLERVDPELWS